MSDERQQKSDVEHLLAQPPFLRFLWRVIQIAGLFDRTDADGSERRRLDHEGRRNLGLDILEMAEAGQPAAHPDGLPILTLIQTLREETQKQERPNASRRHDRNAELDDPPDPD